MNFSVNYRLTEAIKPPTDSATPIIEVMSSPKSVRKYFNQAEHSHIGPGEELYRL